MSLDDKNQPTMRITVTIPKADHEELYRLAQKKRVSTAWMVREAVDKFLDTESPLFRRHQKSK